MEKNTTPAAPRTNLKNSTVLQLAEKIVSLTADTKKVSVAGPAARYIKELASRLGLTPMQALLTAVFVDQCEDCRIRRQDLANHFAVRSIQILNVSDDLDYLVERGVIARRRDCDGDVSFRISNSVIEGLRKGVLPEPDKMDDLTAQEFFDCVDDLLKRRDNEEIGDEDLYGKFHYLLDNNRHLLLADKIRAYGFSDSVLVLLLARGCHNRKPETPETSQPKTTAATTAATAAPTEKALTEIGYEIEVRDGATYIDGVLVVNKTYTVPADYNPGGLTDECAAAFAKMQAAAGAADVILYEASGFRSYETQEGLYDSYVARDGQEAADRYSARPGSSEHQTGLAIDLNDVSDTFGETPEGQWVAEHCAEYGFILRYPEGKEDKTGYMYEPWHIRYVGEEFAQRLTDSGLCLEEYFGITSEYEE